MKQAGFLFIYKLWVDLVSQPHFRKNQNNQHKFQTFRENFANFWESIHQIRIKMATEEPVNPDLLPQAGISYPLKVEYCPNCSMPVGEVSSKNFVKSDIFVFTKFLHSVKIS